MAYSLGNFQGYPVVRVDEKEWKYDNLAVNYDTFYVRDNGYMFFYDTPVARVVNNSEVRDFDMAQVNRLKKKAITEKAIKEVNWTAQEVPKEKEKKTVKVAEARYVEEKEPVITDTETADRILQNWQGNIDGVLEKLMSKELVIENAFN